MESEGILSQLRFHLGHFSDFSSVTETGGGKVIVIGGGLQLSTSRVEWIDLVINF